MRPAIALALVLFGVVILAVATLHTAAQGSFVPLPPHYASSTPRTSPEPGGAIGPALRARTPTPPSRPELAPLPEWRWWVYAQAPGSDWPPIGEQLLLLQSSIARYGDLTAALSTPSAYTGRRHVALDATGARIGFALGAELPAPGDILAALQRCSAEIEIRVREFGTRHELAALLVDAAGPLLGPVGPGPTRCRLPAGWRGFVAAAGHVSSPVELAPDQRLLMVELRPAAYAVGRLEIPPRTAPAELRFYDLEDPTTGNRPDVAQVQADGTFRLGPVAAGRKQIDYQTDDTWLPVDGRHLELRPGHQDLGVLRVERLRELVLELQNLPADCQSVRVRVWKAQQDVPAELPGMPCNVRDGTVVLHKVRPERIRLDVWSEDGWAGSVEDVDAARAHAVAVLLQPPARLDVWCPGSRGMHARVLVSPDRGLLERQRWFVERMAAPGTRMRSIALENGHAAVAGAWPVHSWVMAVADSGAPLGTAELDVPAGQTRSVHLGSAQQPGLVEVSNDGTDAMRFAVVSKDQGVVLRDRVAAGRTLPLSLPPGSYRLVELDGIGGQPPSRGRTTAFEVEAGVRQHLSF